MRARGSSELVEAVCVRVESSTASSLGHSERVQSERDESGRTTFATTSSTRVNGRPRRARQLTVSRAPWTSADCCANLA